MDMTEEEELCADKPPDAGCNYKKPDFLCLFLEKQPPEYIARCGKWVKIHYTNTDPLLTKIRDIYLRKKNK